MKSHYASGRLLAMWSLINTVFAPPDNHLFHIIYRWPHHESSILFARRRFFQMMVMNRIKSLSVHAFNTNATVTVAAMPMWNKEKEMHEWIYCKYDNGCAWIEYASRSLSVHFLPFGALFRPISPFSIDLQKNRVKFDLRFQHRSFNCGKTVFPSLLRFKSTHSICKLYITTKKCKKKLFPFIRFATYWTANKFFKSFLNSHIFVSAMR